MSFKRLDLVVFVIFIAAALIGLNYTEKQYRNEEMNRLQTAIEKAAVSCYATEGFYPADVTYLSENYGIVIDDEKYHVFYESMGSNMKPDVEVFRKGE